MSGFILYRGPSMIDGAPIVAIATVSSRNAKTGAMAQVFILRDDVSPVDAIHSGADRSICGDCSHRGRIELLNDVSRNVDRSCYVTVFQAPLVVFKAYKRGVYGAAPVPGAGARALFAGARVRIGAYGDPAAVPFDVWSEALADVAAHTGYTHQWRDADPRFASIVMASADSESDRDAAKALGYRTFRVRTAGETLAPREIDCPSEQGVKCADCVACGGTSAKARVDIAIEVHGAAGKVTAFNRRAA